MLIYFGILLCVVASQANPLFGGYDEDADKKVLYDQKQKGSWNVHADLKNFLFVIVQSQRSNSSTPSSSALEQGLLYLLSKSAHGQRPHHHQQGKTEEPTSSDEGTKHFIESKSAPYQVDISKNSGGLLSKLYPDQPKEEGVLVAKSPTLSLLKESIGGRAAKALVLAIPREDIVITRTARKSLRKKVRDDQLKKAGSNDTDCEAGKVKDSYGKCKVLKY